MQHLFNGLMAGLLLLSLPLNAAEHPQLDAFPKAQQGKLRFVITLPEKSRDEEQSFKVELIAGKKMLTDGVNQIRLGTLIRPQPLEGWGYTYYEVESESASISTMMAVPEGTKKVEKFITTAPLLIRYNSRLPIVIYVPTGYKVQYRVWAAPDHYQSAGQG